MVFLSALRKATDTQLRAVTTHTLILNCRITRLKIQDEARSRIRSLLQRDSKAETGIVSRSRDSDYYEYTRRALRAVLTGSLPRSTRPPNTYNLSLSSLCNEIEGW